MEQKHTLASQHGSLGLAPVSMLKKRGKELASLQKNIPAASLAVGYVHTPSRIFLISQGEGWGFEAWEMIRALLSAPNGRSVLHYTWCSVYPIGMAEGRILFMRGW